MNNLNKYYKKIWNDPVWSKVIAVGIITLITLIVNYWNEIVNSIKLPTWLGYSLLAIIVLLLSFVIFKWITNSKQKVTPSIGVRYDVLGAVIDGSQLIMNMIMFDIEKETKLISIVSGIKETLWEYKMHGLEYGKDWELMCWETKRIYKKSDLTSKLSQLGIKKKYTLEIIAYFSKERAEEIPNAPEAYINYGSLGAD